jgi:hypothetical protein
MHGEEHVMTQTSQVRAEPDNNIKSFQIPGDATAELDSNVQQVNVSSIVSIVSAEFLFQENSNTPGRFLEQSRVVNVPPGTGFFVGLNVIGDAFVTSNFTSLRERPLGQFYVAVGLRNPNVLVCQVRLTDANSDDPIEIRVRAFIAFFN